MSYKTVDAAPIRRLLNDVAQRWETGQVPWRQRQGVSADGRKLRAVDGRNQCVTYSPFDGMAKTSGLSADYLQKLATGKRLRISIVAAEAIVDNLVGAHAWHCDPELEALLDSVIPVAA